MEHPSLRWIVYTPGSEREIIRSIKVMKVNGKETGANEPVGAEVETERFIDKKEVARRTRIHPRTINVWMNNGLVPFYKMGRSVRFKWSEVEKHLAERSKVLRDVCLRGNVGDRS